MYTFQTKITAGVVLARGTEDRAALASQFKRRDGGARPRLAKKHGGGRESQAKRSLARASASARDTVQGA